MQHNYTADIENFKYINLNVLKTFRNRYPGMILGLSDHTLGSATVLGAVALGARVIEKHFTDDNSRVGPDHKFAMNPTTWTRWCR
jgi:N-acetylneuraminate synthase